MYIKCIRLVKPCCFGIAATDACLFHAYHTIAVPVVALVQKLSDVGMDTRMQLVRLA